ncbi:hypothetical protein BJX62DRAFT_240953 [Aspergillus germanicus]
MAHDINGTDAVELGQLPAGQYAADDPSAKQHLLTSESENDHKQPSRLSENSIRHSANSLNTEPSTLSSNEQPPKVDPESFTVWTRELVTLIISIGTIVVIVLVLRRYDGRQQPDWQGISLNSLLSWLSTVAKACLLFSLTESLGQLKWAWISSESQPLSDLKVFDSASRGGLFGSLELLWRVKGHHFAAVGSLAIILSLGFDPFVQNLLHYVSDSIDSPSQASLLGSTSRYNTAGPLIGASLHYVDPVLKANVYNSLFNVNSTANWAVPSYTCTTGNCTWDPIATIAIRPACSDVTAKLNRTCVMDTKYKDIRNCSASLSDNGPSAWYREGGSVARAMDVSTTAATDALEHTGGIFPVVQYVLAVGSNKSPDSTWTIVDTVNNQTKFIAAECALELVVRSVQADITEGEYAETTLAEWDKWQSPNSSLTADYQAVLTPPWNATLGLTTANLTFGIGYEAWSAISSFLSAIFTGSVNAASGSFGFSATEGSYATSDTLEAIFYGDFNTTIASCTDQLSCAISNVAAAMTKTLRDTAFRNSGSGSDADQSLARGQTMVTVPFVEIHWEWLALPLLVWILTCLVWLAAVVKTRRGRTYKWANNPLPLLFLYDKRREDEDNAQDADSLRGRREFAVVGWTETAIDRRAEMIKARLHTNGREVMLSS